MRTITIKKTELADAKAKRADQTRATTLILSANTPLRSLEDRIIDKLDSRTLWTLESRAKLGKVG